MQQNSAESSTKLTKSPENVLQQPSTSSTRFPRPAYNHRFAITPESMGMNLPPNSDSTPYREQNVQQETPLGELRSYHERYNRKILDECKYEVHESYHSPHSNTPMSSYTDIIEQPTLHKANNRTEYVTQSPSPNVSPKTRLHQWNFECAQLRSKFPPDNNLMQTLLSPRVQTETRGQFCYEQQLQKQRSDSDIVMDSSAKLNFDILNDTYSKRIESIDVNACGDKDLKIFTYQEWVEMLTKINESFISNMEELEREVEAHLNLVHRRVNSNCRHSQGNELMKCRKDIDTLLRYIRKVRNSNEWDLQGWTFETIKPSEILGDYDTLLSEANDADETKNLSDADNGQKNKLYANMKALAHEVAEKHDEVRELKRQVICLEEEIQKAQKKIQFKDDVIKELRNDLKCATNNNNNNKISAHQQLNLSPAMPPINYENLSVYGGDTTPATLHIDNDSHFESLSHTEMEEQQTIKMLEKEIVEFFKLSKDFSEQKMESQRKRLMEIVEKIESEKAAAYHKLDFIRRQLIELQSSSDKEDTPSNFDNDSGFHSKSENDQDAKLFDAIRNRLHKVNDLNCELRKRIYNLELEKSELSNNFESQKLISKRNDEVLKEIAELLCKMKGEQFSYVEVYNKGTTNPFCECIMDMQTDFLQRETVLLKALDEEKKQVFEVQQPAHTLITTSLDNTLATSVPAGFDQ